MSEIDNYLLKARDAIRSGDADKRVRVAKEIISAFRDEIPHLANFRVTALSGQGDFTEDDLRQLMGKLRVLREKNDMAIYGPYGLEAISDAIRQLENALLDTPEKCELEQIYDRIDYLYANRLDAYTDGLCGWHYNDDVPSDGQTRLRIEKLRHYRDEELRELKVAEAQAGKTYVSQSQSQSQQASARAQSIVTVNLEETVEKIEELPESSLSEDDKVFLEGLMANLDAAAKKEKPSKKERLNKLLGFLTDKGVDVVIAVWPFIWNIIQKG